jgi:hypothetical protein
MMKGSEDLNLHLYMTTLTVLQLLRNSSKEGLLKTREVPAYRHERSLTAINGA